MNSLLISLPLLLVSLCHICGYSMLLRLQALDVLKRLRQDDTAAAEELESLQRSLAAEKVKHHGFI